MVSWFGVHFAKVKTVFVFSLSNTREEIPSSALSNNLYFQSQRKLSARQLRGQVGVVFYSSASHLLDRTWAEFQSISTWLEGFSPGTPVFLPLQNRIPVTDIWPGCCAPGSCMTAQPLRRLSYAFGQSCWAAPLAIQHNAASKSD